MNIIFNKTLDQLPKLKGQDYYFAEFYKGTKDKKVINYIRKHDKEYTNWCKK